MKLFESFGILSFFVLLACAWSPPAGAQTYLLTEVGTLGGSASVAYALNDLGQVAGISTLPPNDFPIHGFFWQAGDMIDLGALGGGFSSYAYGINNQTQVVGHSQIGGGGQHAFLWENGVMVDLNSPSGTPSEANDINDSGQITGIANAGFAYIWQDGELMELGTLPGFSGSIGFGINSGGEVAGGAYFCHFCPGRGFYWADGVMSELGPLPGYDSSGALALNDVGLIVGASNNVIPSAPRATLWDDGEAIDLGIAEGTRSFAYGINNAGVIVGYWGTGDHPASHFATKWVDGELIDLNELIPSDSGWQLSEALDINESGQITGLGLNPDGLWRGFLLTPCDFSGGPGDDCDDNGVPDECQFDCNGNGQPDVCDIADGISGDCDGDNVPDECDIGPPITQQPADQEVQEGDIAFFIIEADGLYLEYQWRKDGVDLTDTERILGSQTPALVILDVQSSDAGEYDCAVTDLLAATCAPSDPAMLTVIVTCAPDFDCDGNVGPIDLAQLLASWGPCPDEGACPADLNADGTVGPADLAMLLASWG